MKELNGKRLLVLGGTYASLDVVKTARSLGAHVIVTDEASVSERVAKQAANESRFISTADIDGLLRLVKSDRIDGVFCGPSEFNIRNMIKLCERADLPCYATEKQWDMCSDKLTVKEYCRRNSVPTAERYPISAFECEGADASVTYPVIVKPADGCSSKGIAVCYDRKQTLSAIRNAQEFSAKGSVFAEQYIDNGGRIFGVRYILDNGECYPYLAIDTYVVDPTSKKHLISGFTELPSELASLYAEKTDGCVRRMLADMGLKNGTVFFQTIPLGGKFYLTDMGYRLSGGMFCKITEPLRGINDMRMMIRYALGEAMCTEAERATLVGLSALGATDDRQEAGGQLCIPLNAGKIADIRGLEEATCDPCVTDFLQYYRVGDTVSESVIGTLGQHFGRFTLTAGSKAELRAAAERVQELLHITDEGGAEMFTLRFDTARIARKVM